MGKKRIWLTLLLLLAVTAGACWTLTHRAPPQIITLPDGERYRFVGVTWGTNNVQPEFAARLINRLPPRLKNLILRTEVGRRLGPAPSPFLNIPREPFLVVWFKSWNPDASLPGAPLRTHGMLADRTGSVGGGMSYATVFASAASPTNPLWLTFSFSLVPRRTATLECVLFKATDKNPVKGPFIEIGRVNFPNPLFGHYPEWKPESLPAVKITGDLEVRLKDISSGILRMDPTAGPGFGRVSFRPVEKGEDSAAIFHLDIFSPRGTNEHWDVHQAELSDATGNQVHHVSVRPAGERWFETALWPDEPAWRLAFELKRPPSVTPAVCVTFTNVPVPEVGEKNMLFLTNQVEGTTVVLKQEFWRRPDLPDDGFILVGANEAATRVTAELVGKPRDIALDFVGFSSDTGWTPKGYGRNSSDFTNALFLSYIPADMQTLSITWAVQKTRHVEFLVKPPKAN